jgi:hypothetical protein
MIRNTLGGLLVAGIVASVGGASFAQEQPGTLFAKTIAKCPSPQLADVGGREYKCLFNIEKFSSDPDVAFKEMWGKIKAASAKAGFKVDEKEKKPLKVERATKEYFDTPDQDLWKKGYIVRLSTKFKDGEETLAVTVKAVTEDVVRCMATPLTVVGAKGKTEAEGNVGLGPQGLLREYIEKGSSFPITLAELGALTLGDFGKFMPELLKLGLPAATKLVGKKAYTYRVKPGAVVLPGTEPCGISMEAWAHKDGGKPFLIDFSYGYGDLDFYESKEVHVAGEAFMLKVINGELKDLLMPNSGTFGGSKVRVLMNRPITN